LSNIIVLLKKRSANNTHRDTCTLSSWWYHVWKFSKSQMFIVNFVINQRHVTPSGLS